jgi:tetratricopeptide (TPR) repeat protein
MTGAVMLFSGCGGSSGGGGVTAKDPEQLSTEALILWAGDDLEAALENYEAALDINSNYSQANFGAATIRLIRMYQDPDIRPYMELLSDEDLPDDSAEVITEFLAPRTSGGAPIPYELISQGVIIDPPDLLSVRVIPELMIINSYYKKIEALGTYELILPADISDDGISHTIEIAEIYAINSNIEQTLGSTLIIDAYNLEADAEEAEANPNYIPFEDSSYPDYGLLIKSGNHAQANDYLVSGYEKSNLHLQAVLADADAALDGGIYYENVNDISVIQNDNGDILASLDGSPRLMTICTGVTQVNLKRFLDPPIADLADYYIAQSYISAQTLPAGYDTRINGLMPNVGTVSLFYLKFGGCL